MDPQKFDDLIRSITTTRLTRLTALRGMVAGAAAAVTGASLVSEADAAKKKRQSKSKKKGKKKGAKKGATQRSATSGGGGGGGGLSAQAHVACSLTNFTDATNSNPTCPVVAGAQSISGIDPADGDDSETITSNGCTCTVSWVFGDFNDGGEATTVTLTTDCYIGSVIVKGGRNSASRTYTLNGCTGTIGPLTTATGQGISHVEICGIVCCEPLECVADGGDVECTNGPISDGCPGGHTIDCPCECGNCSANDGSGICECVDDGETCDADCDCCGEFSECENYICECIPETNPCGTQCGGSVVDRCGNTVECPPCPPSDTCHHSLPEDTQGCMGTCGRSHTSGTRRVCQQNCQSECNRLCPVRPQSNDRECIGADDVCEPSSWTNCRFTG